LAFGAKAPVDPTQRLVAVVKLNGDKWRIHGCFGEDQTLTLPRFGEFEVAVRQLFLPKRAA
jgi:hypothetical protein